MINDWTKDEGDVDTIARIDESISGDAIARHGGAPRLWALLEDAPC